MRNRDRAAQRPPFLARPAFLDYSQNPLIQIGLVLAPTHWGNKDAAGVTNFAGNVREFPYLAFKGVKGSASIPRSFADATTNTIMYSTRYAHTAATNVKEAIVSVETDPDRLLRLQGKFDDIANKRLKHPVKLNLDVEPSSSANMPTRTRQRSIEH